MKKTKVLIIVFLSLILLPNQLTHAQFLSKIALKDKNSDWIEISIPDGLKQEIEIKDDSLISKISPEQITDEKIIIIHFKSKSEKTESSSGIFHVYTNKNGLTGTSEQITIETDEGIIDTVCWQDSSPTASEKTDIAELKKVKAWQGNCINSEKIQKNERIERIKNSNTKESWKIVKLETDGDLSQKIIINEIFPNPAGKDSGKEWIELYNASEKKVNLGNWKIKDLKLSNKIEIPPHQFIIISDLSLKNENEIIELKDFQNTLISELRYKKAEEGLALSLSSIKKGNLRKKSWIWTTPSKNTKNQTFYELTGKISKEPEINKEYYFQITNDQDRQTKIIIDENLHNFLLLQSIFKKGSKINVLAKKESAYILEDFKIIDPEITETEANTATPKWTYYLLIPIFLMTFVLIAIL